jgi:hypothetical protein
MTNHQGTINIHRLHKALRQDGMIKIFFASRQEKKNNFSIGMGGEVSNSYCTTYETAYFFQALFLSAIGTLALTNNRLEKYQQSKTSATDEIKHDLLTYSNEEIFLAMQKPQIAIISSLDTDIEPVRYNKHQLWNLTRKQLGRRIDSLDVSNCTKKRGSRVNHKRWTRVDEDIAACSIQEGGSLMFAKARQMFLTFSIACEQLGLDIENIPIYFNFVPRQEIIDNGPNNSYIKVLLALHDPKFKKEFSKRTGIRHPWFISTPCPKCNAGSKRVISSHLLADARTVRSVCKKQPSRFRDEQGSTIELTGCGHKWDMSIPKTTNELWQLMRDNDIAVHFAIRWLICLLKDTIDTPIGYVLTDIGVKRDSFKNLAINPDTVPGYGDHRRMLTSALEIQEWLINSESSLSNELKVRDLLMPKPLLLFGYDNPTRLVDRETPVIGSKLFASDTSFLKFLESHNIQKIFSDSIRLYPYDLATLRSLKKYE